MRALFLLAILLGGISAVAQPSGRLRRISGAPGGPGHLDGTGAEARIFLGELVPLRDGGAILVAEQPTGLERQKGWGSPEERTYRISLLGGKGRVEALGRITVPLGAKPVPHLDPHGRLRFLGRGDDDRYYLLTLRLPASGAGGLDLLEAQRHTFPADPLLLYPKAYALDGKEWLYAYGPPKGSGQGESVLRALRPRAQTWETVATWPTFEGEKPWNPMLAQDGTGTLWLKRLPDHLNQIRVRLLEERQGVAFGETVFHRLEEGRVVETRALPAVPAASGDRTRHEITAFQPLLSGAFHLRVRSQNSKTDPNPVDRTFRLEGEGRLELGPKAGDAPLPREAADGTTWAWESEGSLRRIDFEGRRTSFGALGEGAEVEPSLPMVEPGWAERPYPPEGRWAANWVLGPGHHLLADSQGVLHRWRPGTPPQSLSHKVAIQGPILQKGGTFWGVSGTSLFRVGGEGPAHTLAGHPTEGGHADGEGTAARFGAITQLLSDERGGLFVLEREKAVIRHVDAVGRVRTVVGTPFQMGLREGALPATLPYCVILGLAPDGTLRLESSEGRLAVEGWQATPTKQVLK